VKLRKGGGGRDFHQTKSRSSGGGWGPRRKAGKHGLGFPRLGKKNCGGRKKKETARKSRSKGNDSKLDANVEKKREKMPRGGEWRKEKK